MTPSSMDSVTPPAWRYATAGTAYPAASMTTRPQPSLSEGRTSTQASARCRCLVSSSTKPTKSTRSSTPSRRDSAVELVGPPAVADHPHAQVGQPCRAGVRQRRARARPACGGPAGPGRAASGSVPGVARSAAPRRRCARRRSADPSHAELDQLAARHVGDRDVAGPAVDARADPRLEEPADPRPHRAVDDRPLLAVDVVDEVHHGRAGGQGRGERHAVLDVDHDVEPARGVARSWVSRTRG